jgi:hypothetical protein
MKGITLPLNGLEEKEETDENIWRKSRSVSQQKIATKEHNNHTIVKDI